MVPSVTLGVGAEAVGLDRTAVRCATKEKPK